ncbi:superoxide dismutase family protein [Kocuria sp. cx-455]|uniref:superoxide dismutase family protein n=1 Tax=Kocuria sp. cx-455 TaxID=2771377 RepID=UPI003D75CE75
MNERDLTSPTPATDLATTPAKKTSLTRTGLAFLGIAGLLTLAACGNDGGGGASEETGGQETSAAASESEPLATANVQNTEGEDFGTVEFSPAENDDQAMVVSAELSGLEPGYYGFHVHTNGVCEAESSATDDPSETGAFLSAGGHLGGDDARHPEHDGDLPALLVMESGEAKLTFQTDRLTTETLMDDNGSALMIHSDPDNYANIPERYAAAGPDEDTQSTGDAGSRLACGVIE